MELLIGIAIGLLILWALLVAVLWLLRPRGVATAEIVRAIRDLLRMVRALLPDGTVPLGVRMALIGMIAWVVNPIDLIPEFIPVLGPLDDIVVAVLVLCYVRRRLGITTLRERWPGTPEGFATLGRLLGGE